MYENKLLVAAQDRIEKPFDLWLILLSHAKSLGLRSSVALLEDAGQGVALECQYTHGWKFICGDCGDYGVLVM